MSGEYFSALGRFAGTRGPGLFFIIPGIDKLVRVSLRTVVMDVPPQDVITHDNVTVKVSAQSSTFASWSLKKQ